MAKGLIGIDNVMRNLNREIRKIKKAGTAGLINASIVIRRDMDKRTPLIPVDEGNLRASWFTTIGNRVPHKGGAFTGEDSGKLGGDHSKVVGNATARANAIPHPLLIMGFSAGYAGFVHDAKFDKGKRPGSGPKFFETAIKRNQKLVLKIIANEIKF